MFNSNEVTKELLTHHCNLVWENTTHGTNTPEYFRKFTTTLDNDTKLNEIRNTRKLKYVMMGNKLWNSLTSDFKIESSDETEEFKRENEYDGPLLWEYIRRRVNSSTMVGASRLKDQIESRTISSFDSNVIKYNTWFSETRAQIIKEDGDGYNEYLRLLFRIYLTRNDNEFDEK